MSDEDNDRRNREQQDASESRLRRLMGKVSGEKRDEFWLRLGYDVSTPAGFERLNRTLSLPASLGIDVTDNVDVKEKKEAIIWAVRAQKRAVTFGTRMLAWITASIAIIGGLMGIVKYLQDWRGH